MTRVPLQELLDLSDSGVWGDEDTKTGVSVLRSTNFNTNGTLDFSNLSFRVIEDRKRESKLLREGDILLEKSGGGPKQPVGRVCLFRGHNLPHSFGNFIARLRPKANVLSEFLFYFLWHFHATGKTSHYQKQTTGIRNLEYKRFLTIEVPVPPLPEQRRIVDLLARAEGIVRLRREAEKKAAELIPALFLDMFGDPATNPKRWPEHSLGDIAEVVSGVTKGRKFGDKQTVEVPYLRVANVQAGHIDLTELKTIEVLPRDVEQLALQNGDVVLTEGGDFDKLGRGALWEHGIANCIHQNHVFRVRCKQSMMLPQFFVIYLQSSRAREYFLRCAKRTTNLASINMTQLRALPVVLPAMDAQLEFVERFAAGRSIQSQQTTATTKAQETFDALLGQVFS